MPYARTDPVEKPAFQMGPCPKDSKVPCNKYDTRKIHHEEPFNGISSDTHTIGHQDTQTIPSYTPTSVYPIKGAKTGFVQNKQTKYAPQVAHIHFAQKDEEKPETSQYLPPATPPVTPPQYTSRDIVYEKAFDGVERGVTTIGTQTVGTQPYVPTPSFPSKVRLGFNQRPGSFVQLEDEEADHSSEFFTAEFDGVTPLGGEQYNRVVPDQFGEETEEKFMRSIYTKFALEQKTKEGKPSGVFKMDKSNTKSVANQVMGRVKKLQGKDLDAFTNQYFQRTWDHFDVNQTGYLDTLDMTAFMKYMASDQGIDLDGLFATNEQ